jgi:hypothetical protein
MTLPDSRLSVSDGALGVVENNGRVSACVGTCERGTAGTVYAFTDLDTVRDTLGVGPLSEAIGHKLAVAGGIVFGVRATPDTAGAAGSVTHTGTGTSVATVSGAVNDAFRVRIAVERAGASLAATPPATFTVSIDGGTTVSGAVPMPTNGVYPIPNTGGLTVTFAAGTFVAGDAYAFDCTAPGYNAATTTTALTALRNDSRTWKHVHCVGGAATVANARLIANAASAALATAEGEHRYAYAIVECPTDTDGNITAAFSTLTAPRVCVAAGKASVVSPFTGLAFPRSAAFPFAARRHGAPISEDAGRVRSGALPLIDAIDRDEATTPALDAERFVTLRTFVGKRGYYITNGNTMAETGSDFALVQHREVMDATCAVHRAATLPYVNDSLRVNPANVSAPLVAGAIDERDARAFESDVGGKLRAAIVAPGYATDVTVTANRSDNILSTRTLRSKVRVLPLGYSKYLESELGYLNPALGG